MDAQSNSSKQDYSDRPSDTPNSSSKPRRMTVAQKALAPFAHLRSIQQKYGPRSVEAFGAQQKAEQTVQRSGSTEDLDNVTAKAQKDMSSSSQTPGAQARQVPLQAKHLTRFEAEYNARRLAAAIEGPKFDSLLSQAGNQTQSCPDMLENPAPAHTHTCQTQNTCLFPTLTSNKERHVAAEEGASLSNLAVQHPVSIQNQADITAQSQKDISRSSDTYKAKVVPDVQRKIKSWELSMAKTQFDEWNDIPTVWTVTIENLFKTRLEDFTKSQGVELQDVVFTPIRFCKSQADAQAHYEALLAEFRNNYPTRQAAPAVAQAKVDHQAQPPKQAPSQAQNPIQSSPEMLKNPTASAQNQAPPQAQAQTQSTSEMIENPAPAQTQDTCQLKTQVSNKKGQDEAKKGISNLPMTCSESQNSTQDSIPVQEQKGTPQHPAGAQKAPQAQPSDQAPIKTKPPPQAKSQSSHSKLAYVQSTAKLNEVALAKVQVDFYNECNPEYWARMEKHFVKRIEAIAKSHGVDPQDVVINSVPLAKSRDEAQAQYKTLFNMAREAGHSNIVAEHTASEITSQKGCLTQDNLLNQIALLKMELAETKASQDQTLQEFDAKSEKTRLEHLKQVDYLQKRIKMGQVENQLLSSKLSEEQSTLERLRASLEESEKEVERLKRVLKAKSVQKVRVPLPAAQLPDKSVPAVEKTVSPTVSQIIALNKEMADEQAKANAQRHAEVLAAIQSTVQESFKAAAEEKAKIEAKAKIYAEAYVKAKNEAKAKARAEAEAKNKTQSQPLRCPQSCAEALPKTQSEVQVKNLQKVIDQLIKSYRNSSEKYQEQIRCLEYDIQELSEATDYEIEALKKEVAEKDDKILELQKELWKVIDERQEARLDAEKLAMQLCNNW